MKRQLHVGLSTDMDSLTGRHPQVHTVNHSHSACASPPIKTPPQDTTKAMYNKVVRSLLTCSSEVDKSTRKRSPSTATITESSSCQQHRISSAGQQAQSCSILQTTHNMANNKHIHLQPSTGSETVLHCFELQAPHCA